MKYDIRTKQSTMLFIEDFFGVTEDDIYYSDFFDLEKSPEEFFYENIEKIKKVDISNINLYGFHIQGSLDKCADIKRCGIMNLHEVLKSENSVSKFLKDNNIEILVDNKCLKYKGMPYSLDFEKYRYDMIVTDEEKALSRLAYRICKDYNVNGFFVNNKVKEYGEDVYICPEFITDLSRAIPEAAKIRDLWIDHAQSYKINFRVTLEQIDPITFGMNSGEKIVNNEMKVKKWMIITAWNILFNNSTFNNDIIYLKKDFVLPKEQIIMIEEIN